MPMFLQCTCFIAKFGKFCGSSYDRISNVTKTNHFPNIARRFRLFLLLGAGWIKTWLFCPALSGEILHLSTTPRIYCESMNWVSSWMQHLFWKLCPALVPSRYHNVFFSFIIISLSFYAFCVSRACVLHITLIIFVIIRLYYSYKCVLTFPSLIICLFITDKRDSVQ